jgi:thiol-disulfide isomerase/thioredoxin
MANHKDIEDDEEFSATLQSAGNKLVVVDFNATWCGPCQKMHPIFIQLAHKFPHALFLGVDVDKCRESAMAQGITAMPTFNLYKNKVKIDQVKGAHAQNLEDAIRKHYGQPETTDPHAVGPQGQTDIFPYIEKKGCECLNSADSTPFHSFLEGKSKLLSDCDEQLILVYGFNQNVKLHSFKIKAPVEKGPKTVKFFINHPKTLDFDSALGMKAVQEITLSEMDLKGEEPVHLKFVKFQNVSNLQLFISENQTGDDVTEIEAITFYGMPQATTNMQDFKRIAGNKGESH